MIEDEPKTAAFLRKGFTEAGFVVPEPASLLTLGTVLLIMGGLWRKKARAKRS